MAVDSAPMVLRVGMDGAVTRVPFAAGERGAGPLLRAQIGCSMYECLSLDEKTDMWSDEEALVGVDVRDRAALAELLNPVATMIANHFDRRQPVFGTVVITGLAGESAAPLTVEQLTRLEHFAAMSADVLSGALAARASGERS